MSVSDIEIRLAEVWQELLAIPSIGPDQNLFDLGGDSVVATRLTATVKKLWNVDLPLGLIFEAPTVRSMAALLAGKISPKWSPRIAPLKPAGSRIPFLCVDAGPFFRPLTQRLDADQPFLGLRLADTATLPTHFTLEDIAEYHLQTVREFQPTGPYCLGGWSAGGLVAYEVAQRLRAAGEEVRLLVLFDVMNWASQRRRWGWKSFYRSISVLAWRVRYFLSSLSRLQGHDRWAYIQDALEQRYLNFRRILWLIGDKMQRHISRPLPLAPREPSKAVFVASQTYCPKPYDGRVLLLRSAIQQEGPYHDRDLGWKGLIADMDICDMPGDHDDMFLTPHVDRLATELERRLSQIGRSESVYALSDTGTRND